MSGYTLPDERTRKNALFHYTTGEGLNGIVFGNSIWLSDLRCSNDGSEVEYGNHLIRKVLSEYTSKNIVDPKSIFSKAYNAGGDVEGFPDMFSNLIYELMYTSVVALIFCLCRHSNQEHYQHGLLSQWRGYGEDGGYAIQFNKEKLNRILKSEFEENSGNSITFRKVHYGNKGPAFNLISKNQDELVLRYKQYIEYCYKFMPGDLRPLADFSADLLDAIGTWLALSKSPHFSEENEWRIVAFSIMKDNDRLKFRSRNGTIVPYIEVARGNIVECIDRVIVGPHPQQAVRVKTAQALLRSQGIRVPVYPSQIPLVKQ